MRNLGLSVKREHDANGKSWLFFVFWYPVKWNKELGYKYASLRWL